MKEGEAVTDVSGSSRSSVELSGRPGITRCLRRDLQNGALWDVSGHVLMLCGSKSANRGFAGRRLRDQSSRPGSAASLKRCFCSDQFGTYCMIVTARRRAGRHWLGSPTLAHGKATRLGRLQRFDPKPVGQAKRKRPPVDSRRAGPPKSRSRYWLIQRHSPKGEISRGEKSIVDRRTRSSLVRHCRASRPSDRPRPPGSRRDGLPN